MPTEAQDPQYDGFEDWPTLSKIHLTQVTPCKRQAIDGMTGVFSDKVRRAEDNEAEVKELHAKVGKLAVENDFLSQRLKRLARANARL